MKKLIAGLIVSLCVTSSYASDYNNQVQYNKLNILESFPPIVHDSLSSSHLAIDPYKGFKELIESAHKDIYIQAFYLNMFVAQKTSKNKEDDQYDQSQRYVDNIIMPLVHAAKRGVKINILLSRQSGIDDSNAGSNLKTLNFLMEMAQYSGCEKNIIIKTATQIRYNPRYGIINLKDKSGKQNFDQLSQIGKVVKYPYNRNENIDDDKKFDTSNAGIVHTKAISVDGVSFFIGSNNFDAGAIEHSHDVGLIYIGKNSKNNQYLQDAKDLQSILMNDFAGNLTLKPYQQNLILNNQQHASQILISPGNGVISGSFDKNVSTQDTKFNRFDQSNEERQFLNLITNPKTGKNVYIQTENFGTTDFYFNQGKTTWDSFYFAIKTALNEGKHIKILFSGKDFAYVDDAILNAPLPLSQEQKAQLYANFYDLYKLEQKYNSLKKSGKLEIGFTDYYPNQIEKRIDYAQYDHAKYMSVGDNVWISNSNVTETYFEKNRDLGILLMNNSRVSNFIQNSFNKVWNNQKYTFLISKHSVRELQDKIKDIKQKA